MCNVSLIFHILFFQGCLGLIYTVYIDSLSFPLEGLVANLFTFQVPVAGGSQVRFNLTEVKHTQITALHKNVLLSVLRSFLESNLLQMYSHPDKNVTSNVIIFICQRSITSLFFLRDVVFESQNFFG